jgi:DNA-binding NarL/FixJ family response regulator
VTLRVLIVDDHPEFRWHARRLLELEGLEVVGEAVDAASALESARVLRPDVVLLDIGLPDASGLEIVDRLCPPGSPGPAVVLISTRAARDLGPLLRRSNARGFIAKHELSGSRIDALAG